MSRKKHAQLDANSADTLRKNKMSSENKLNVTASNDKNTKVYNSAKFSSRRLKMTLILKSDSCPPLDHRCHHFQCDYHRL